MKKTKVLSVRLSLDTLMSCFDFCQLIDRPTPGASAAIARSLEILMANLRQKGTLPSYTETDLDALLKQFIGAKNPTSMPSLEKLSLLDIEQRDYTSLDFAPQAAVIVREASPVQREKSEEEIRQEIREEKQELDEALDKEIADLLKEEQEDFLKKILIQ